MNSRDVLRFLSQRWRGPQVGALAPFGAAALAFGATLVLAPSAAGGPPIVLAAKLLLAGALATAAALAVQGAIVLARALRRGTVTGKDVALGAGVLAFALAGFGFWLLGQWPGMYMTDSAACLEATRRLVLDEWYSYLYLWYWRALSLLGGGSPGAIAAVQALASAVGVTLVTLFLIRRGGPRWVILGSAALFVLSPANGINAVFLTRDWLFGWCHLTLALAAPALALRSPRGGGTSQRPFAFAGLVLLLAWTARLRGDGLVLLVVVPLAYGFAGAMSRRAAALFGVLSLALFLVIDGPLARALKAEKPTVRYSMTTVLNPLGAIMRDPHYSPHPAMDEAVIQRVVPVSALKAKHVPYELPVVWEHDVRADVSASQFERLAGTTARLAWDNPDLFLGSRLITFLATLGLSSRCFRYDDELGRSGGWTKEILDRWGVKKAPIVPAFRAVQQRIEDATYAYEGTASAGVLVWNSAVALGLACWALAGFRRARRTAAAAAIILARVPVIFLFEPAAQFKYLYSLYLFGFFVIALFLTERSVVRDRRPGLS